MITTIKTMVYCLYSKENLVKKYLLGISAFIMSVTLLFAQKTPPSKQPVAQTKNSASTAKQDAVVSNTPQEWEYLVISYGTTYFSDAEKTDLYYPLTHDIGQEGTELQKSLDGLGKLGWELITVTGTISGDQELILKRKYDENNKERDAKIIGEESEKFNKEMIDDWEKESKEAEKTKKLVAEKKALVDLDKVEKETESEKSNEEFASFGSDMQKFLQDNYHCSVSGENEYYRYVINASFDLTADFLSNGNEYRSSLVKQYFDDVDRSISVADERIQYRTLVIKYSGYIMLNDQKIEVYSNEVEYKKNDEK